jgi:hypothetical protein
MMIPVTVVRRPGRRGKGQAEDARGQCEQQRTHYKTSSRVPMLFLFRAVEAGVGWQAPSFTARIVPTRPSPAVRERGRPGELARQIAA